MKRRGEWVIFSKAQMEKKNKKKYLHHLGRGVELGQKHLVLLQSPC